MGAILAMPLSQYPKFYYRYAIDCWDHMTPSQYGGILIFVAVCGWLSMKSQQR